MEPKVDAEGCRDTTAARLEAGSRGVERENDPGGRNGANGPGTGLHKSLAILRELPAPTIGRSHRGYLMRSVRPGRARACPRSAVFARFGRVLPLLFSRQAPS